MATTFTAGQQVRLTATYRGKSFSWNTSPVSARPAPLVSLPVGTVFVVHNRQRNEPTRLDGPTVLVKNDAGTWCIPARLLEAVSDAAV